MSNIQPYAARSPLNRTGRALQRLTDDTTLAVAVVESRIDIEIAKVDGITAVAGRAMQNVALLSQVEVALSQAVPHASGRLSTIADLAALSLADVVAGTARRLGCR